MAQVQVGDHLKRGPQDPKIYGRSSFDPWDRHYVITAIGNCGKVCLKSLGDGVDGYCTLFRDWRTFSLWRNGTSLGIAEHYRVLEDKQ